MNPFWMWAALSAILFAGEILTTSFVLVFFAVAALIMAVAVAIVPMPNEVQLIVFGLLGLLGLAVGRKWIRARLAARAAPDFSVDEKSEFTADRELAIGAEGAMIYQGAPWTVVNSGSSAIAVGDRVRVVKTAGIKLIIERVGQ